MKVDDKIEKNIKTETEKIEADKSNLKGLIVKAIESNRWSYDEAYDILLATEEAYRLKVPKPITAYSKDTYNWGNDWSKGGTDYRANIPVSNASFDTSLEADQLVKDATSNSVEDEKAFNKIKKNLKKGKKNVERTKTYKF